MPGYICMLATLLNFKILNLLKFMPNMAMYISIFLNYTFYIYAYNNTEYQVCSYLPAVVQWDNGH